MIGKNSRLTNSTLVNNRKTSVKTIRHSVVPEHEDEHNSEESK
jgi:hypothetical protein